MTTVGDESHVKCSSAKQRVNDIRTTFESTENA